MKIVSIREATVALGVAARNAAIDFGAMTASAVVVESDQIRNGRPVVGLGFDSIGRYGHGGLLRERFIPRLLDSPPEDYAASSGVGIDPQRAHDVMLRNEKPGGHGERAGAVGVLDSALWDLAAKTADVPLWLLLSERFAGGKAIREVPVYASGGHYHPHDDLQLLASELRDARGRGHRRFKIKIAAGDLEADKRRIDTALAAIGADASLAVDANCSFDRHSAPLWLDALSQFPLAWVEEPVDPLDYQLQADLAAEYTVSFGTGENLFSRADLQNLLRHGGLRASKDYLQMDVALSYGVPEYVRMLDVIEANGWSRQRCWPHAGHLFALHVVAGLGLGGHETALDRNLPIAGFPDQMPFGDGTISIDDQPGVGLERMPVLFACFDTLL